MWSSLILLDVVKDEVEGSSLFTVVSDCDRGAASDFAGDALFVELALAEPLSQL